MSDVAIAIASFIWGAFIMLCLVMHFFRVTHKLPYRWACPEEDCGFTFATDSPSTITLEIAEDHARAFHQEA